MNLQLEQCIYSGRLGPGMELTEKASKALLNKIKKNKTEASLFNPNQFNQLSEKTFIVHSIADKILIMSVPGFIRVSKADENNNYHEEYFCDGNNVNKTLCKFFNAIQLDEDA